jgi:hypothetical protein
LAYTNLKSRCYSVPFMTPLRDFVVHQNSRVSVVIVSKILESYHLPIAFHILENIKTRNLSESVYNSNW